MKYIKTYEANSNFKECYWYIPYQELNLLTMAMKKLPIPNYVKNNMIKVISEDYDKADFKMGAFIAVVNLKLPLIDAWTYLYCTDKQIVKYGKELYGDYEFKGNIELEPWEIDADKYNL